MAGQRAGAVGLVVCLAGFCGCRGDEGIVLAISGDAAQTLEFIVGVSRDGEILLDEQGGGPRAQVEGRNLRSSPYELWLHPPPALPEPVTIVVLVRGWRVQDGEQRIGSVGVLDPPQSFVRSDLLRRSLQLRNLGDEVATSSAHGCYAATIGDRHWRWRLPENFDCDPVSTGADPPDCDDSTADRYPGAVELCDGLDNDCDELLGPSTSLCYAPAEGDSGPCRRGTRFCEGPGEGAGACEVGSEAAPEAFCSQRFAGCSRLANPAPCLNGLRQQRHCVVRVDPAGELCGPPRIEVEPPRGSESCRWAIFAAGNLTVAFDGDSQTATNCRPTLDLTGSVVPLHDTVTLDFFADDEAGWLVDLAFETEQVASCAEIEAVGCN